MKTDASNLIHGHGVSLITPFNPTGEVDYPALERLAKNLMVSKVDFIVVLGHASEAALLDDDEQVRVMDFISEINRGAKKLVGGVASTSTRNAIRRVSAFNQRDFAAIFCGIPSPKASSNSGYIGHYRSIAQASPLPILMHHDGHGMSHSEWVLEMAQEQNIAGVVDESGSIELMDSWLHNRPDGFSLLTARDAMALPLFALGIDGAISTIGNAFPEAFGEMIDLLAFGAINDARLRHHELAPLMRLMEQEGSPTAIKSILAQLQRCSSAVRLPNTPVSEKTQRSLYRALAQLPSNISATLLDQLN
jgi:4-hydroxy-tetrahydrodipicolinate synthase